MVLLEDEPVAVGGGKIAIEVAETTLVDVVEVRGPP